MIARDLMTCNPVTVSADTTVAEAAGILRDLDIRHLPVIQDGALVGILSDRDLRGVDALLLRHIEDPDVARAQRSVPVVHLMSPDVIAVDPETELDELIGILIEAKIGAVPVIDRTTRQLIGIVSYIDVLRAVQDLLED